MFQIHEIKYLQNGRNFQFAKLKYFSDDLMINFVGFSTVSNPHLFTYSP